MKGPAPLLMLAASAFCASCAEEAPPSPDPAAVERLLVRLDSQSADPIDRLPDKARQKVERAERLVAPLEKVQADKIDPQMALALIE